ncbi:hypothetical protein RchiOBHm_Chr3g0466021 [Rosa chinensis]|uniref:Uncharacterized protein n=1 Tax=Rosa chinensis TaxID=74649 RepID=A0A2P6R9V0_ROSCH|nr:hypothetical protein RchiOBHm_Chr3g0466021 [Rosa chinensis]
MCSFNFIRVILALLPSPEFSLIFSLKKISSPCLRPWLLSHTATANSSILRFFHVNCFTSFPFVLAILEPLNQLLSSEVINLVFKFAVYRFPKF